MKLSYHMIYLCECNFFNSLMDGAIWFDEIFISYDISPYIEICECDTRAINTKNILRRKVHNLTITWNQCEVVVAVWPGEGEEDNSYAL